MRKILFSTGYHIVSDTILTNRVVYVWSEEGVENVKYVSSLLADGVVDLKDFPHVVRHVLGYFILAGLIPPLVPPPLAKVVRNGLFNIFHGESRAADGDRWEGHVFNRVGGGF